MTDRLRDGSGCLKAEPETEPPPIKIDRLAEIAFHLRQLTWAEMVKLGEEANADPAVLHQWATTYREGDND